MEKFSIYIEYADNGAVVKELNDEDFPCSKIVVTDDELDKFLGRLLREYIEKSDGFPELGYKVDINIT